MKKIIFIITMCAAIITGLILYYERDFQVQKPQKVNTAKVAMVRYLSQKGLSEGDYTLNIDYRLDSVLLGYGGYSIEVIYKDEPNVRYGYHYYPDGEITQQSARDITNGDSKNFKHEKE